MTDQPITVRKLVAYIPVPDVLLRPDPEPPVVGTISERPADRYARLVRAVAGIEGRAGDALRGVVELHKPIAQHEHLPDSVECDGDEWSGYEGERPGWPCSTIGEIEHALGLEGWAR